MAILRVLMCVAIMSAAAGCGGLVATARLIDDVAWLVPGPAAPPQRPIDPDEADRRAQDRELDQKTRAAADAAAVATLFQLARQAVATDSCAAAAAIADTVRAQYPRMVATTVATDPGIARCVDWRDSILRLGYDVSTTELPAVTTDALTARLALQLRGAAANHDCRTVDTMLAAIRDRDPDYGAVLAASRVLGECGSRR